jgi:hypothetical protein
MTMVFATAPLGLIGVIPSLLLLRERDLALYDVFDSLAGTQILLSVSH